MKDANSAACEVRVGDDRYVVVASLPRLARDNVRRAQLLTRCEDKLVALEDRVRSGRMTDPAKIGAADDRTLHDSGVGRCFVTYIRQGSFSWDHDHEALHYEEDLLAGRYVITTSLSKEQASTENVVRYYRALQRVEYWFTHKFLPALDAFPKLDTLPAHHRPLERASAGSLKFHRVS
ncbi:MAG: hypothetical protein M0008_02905 [Actinomycetota bacterium]|nr:hypothetical protein [Actinomycetota bacterium]